MRQLSFLIKVNNWFMVNDVSSTSHGSTEEVSKHERGCVRASKAVAKYEFSFSDFIL